MAHRALECRVSPPPRKQPARRPTRAPRHAPRMNGTRADTSPRRQERRRWKREMPRLPHFGACGAPRLFARGRAAANEAHPAFESIIDDAPAELVTAAAVRIELRG